jgi:thiosulfate/3-mercaptopyruvate sulfurtransferase
MIPTFPPIVPADALRARIASPQLRILDASWYLPAMKRDAREEFDRGHIPGARYFDLDAASDPSSPLPHMLPPPEHFAATVARLGVSSGDHVVVYDGSGTNLSAPRAWWMFRAFGHDAVSVLDGGMAAWIASGGSEESGASPVTPRGSFVATPRSVLVRNGHQVRESQDSGGQVVDMRSRGRFEGTQPEPRAGLRGGHIPGSRSVPHAMLVDDQGLLRPETELRALLAAAGVDVNRSVIATCGSGVSACSLLLALDVIGVPGGSLYDGSWSEWGRADGGPVETGSPR